MTIAMTTRPTSHLIHSGFLDILSLIPESRSDHTEIKPPVPKKTEDDLRAILREDAVASPKKKNQGNANGKERVRKDVRRSVDIALRKRKIDKAIIGPPMDFRYVNGLPWKIANLPDMYSTLHHMKKRPNYSSDGR